MNKKNLTKEKLAFHWIVKHPVYYKEVSKDWFEDETVKKVYQSAKTFYTGQDSGIRIAPSLEQIKTSCSIEYPEVSEKILDIILTEQINHENEKWVETKFNEWRVLQDAKHAIFKTIEDYKEFADSEKPDFDKVIKSIKGIKERFQNIRLSSQSNNDYLDFDNAEDHIQPSGKEKISTGYKTLDKIFRGGWDVGTLNVFMGQTSVGKSVWLANLAVNAANAGHNVLYITLEMADRKVMKRLGAIRLNLPIEEYDELSKDQMLIKNKIKSIKKAYGMGGMIVEQLTGKIFVKEFPTSSASGEDIFHFMQQLEEEKGLKINAVMIDYLGIMGTTERGLSLYLTGKDRSESLRAAAQKSKAAFITATQISKDKISEKDQKGNQLSLKDVPESKAIPETADTMLSILRNKNLYNLQLLKGRDIKADVETIAFDLNERTLKIENDRIYENPDN